MEYLRVFATTSYFKWFENQPKLSKLLLCFDVNRNYDPALQVKPVSVFGACNRDEELQTVAALFQTAPVSTVARRFAICITEKDCVEAGIEIDLTRGETGVHFVDTRHAELQGKLENFMRLANVVTQRIWEGESRFRIYSQHTILGEVAILSRQADGVDGDVIQRCKEVLDRLPNLHRFPDGRDVVELIGEMEDKEKNPITATRKLRINPGHGSLLRSLRDRLYELLGRK